MKLHLGCGQRYLQGYTNIDFPPSEHSVQTQSVADRHADLTTLRFARGEVDEVRLHHVFEHFRRPQATSLVAGWNSWMRLGGTLHIEVPDLGKAARVFCNPFASQRARCVAERHLFGSHEAGWAAHYEGYDAGILIALLSAMGFGSTRVKRTHWRGTHNLHVIAQKQADLGSRDAAMVAARTYLSRFLVDDTPGELALLEVWMDAFAKHLESCWALGEP